MPISSMHLHAELLCRSVFEPLINRGDLTKQQNLICEKLFRVAKSLLRAIKIPILGLTNLMAIDIFC